MVVLNIRTISGTNEAAEFLAGRILEKLRGNGKVLWLVPGGSAIPVALQTAKLIIMYPHKGLTVTLTDERYGTVDHRDSNWLQLKEKGFVLPEAKMLPVLNGDDLESTTAYWSGTLEKEFGSNQYKIGLFGVGKDEHTAGIMPGSSAAFADTFACGYNTDAFNRITLTPEAIVRLDEVVLFATGEEKRPAIESLQEEKNITESPVQILKQVPKLTIFTDYKAK